MKTPRGSSTARGNNRAGDGAQSTLIHPSLPTVKPGAAGSDRAQIAYGRLTLTLTRRQARNHIDQLIKKYQTMPKPDRQTITEAGVVHQFLDPLLPGLMLGAPRFRLRAFVEDSR